MKLINFIFVICLLPFHSTFAGVTEMLKNWFENYKGPGEIKVTGFEDKKKSLKMIRNSIL